LDERCSADDNVPDAAPSSAPGSDSKSVDVLPAGFHDGIAVGSFGFGHDFRPALRFGEPGTPFLLDPGSEYFIYQSVATNRYRSSAPTRSRQFRQG
jgi:hypothetical protein